MNENQSDQWLFDLMEEEPLEDAGFSQGVILRLEE